MSQQGLTQSAASVPRRPFTPNVVGLHLAQALVGRSVEVAVGARKFAQGVVSGVFTEAGRPRIVVGRASYDMSQILTITPPEGSSGPRPGPGGSR
ncbi:MAG: hypothetical protein U1F83_01285 [Verrucomicrobiota bacterium]